MSLTWLVLGALVGAVASLARGSVFQIVTDATAGAIVLAVPGLLLGLMGADLKGGCVGATGGLLAFGLAGIFSNGPIAPASLQLMVVFGALLGATMLIYIRTALRMYEMLGSSAWRLISRLRGAEKAAHRVDYSVSRHQSPRYSDGYVRRYLMIRARRRQPVLLQSRVR
jgi:hypothetical protein